MPGSGFGGHLSDSFPSSPVTDDPAPTLPPRIAAFHDSADVADVLKRLQADLIPNERFDVIAQMIHNGDFDAHAQCDAFPMGGLLAQLACVKYDTLRPHLTNIFGALCDRPHVALKDLTIPSYYNGNNSASSQLTYHERQSITHRPLVSWLMETFSLKPQDIAAVAPRLLTQDHRINGTTQPLIHHVLFTNNFSFRDAQALADAAGSTDFLFVTDADGRTPFFQMALTGSRQHPYALDLISWMIDVRPELVHKTDALGWTVLDRYVSIYGNNDGPVLRLLVASGAQLRRQTPPGLSVGDALAFRAANKPDITPRDIGKPRLKEPKI